MADHHGLAVKKSHTLTEKSAKSKHGHHTLGPKKSGVKSPKSKKSLISHPRQEPQRKTMPGPMAAATTKSARKSFAVTGTMLTKRIEPLSTLQHHKENVTVHTNTPALERVSSRAENNPIYQGEVNIISIIDTNKEVMCCKFTEDYHSIAAGFTDGVVRLFDSTTGDCTQTLIDEEIRSYPGPVTAIKHRPVGKAHPVTDTILATYVNGCVKSWKYKYDTCLYTIREKRQTLGICYHPRNPKFVTYGDDCKLNMYDEEAQTQERAFYNSGGKLKDGHFSRVFACSFNPKSNHELISGGWDDMVMCWDDRQPFATRYFEGVHMCGEGLDFDKPGRTILTCSWQEKDSIQIWDYGSCKLIETIVPDTHMSKLYCGKFVPQTNLIVCGGSDSNIIRVVDIELKITEASIRNNPGEVYAFDFGTVRRKPSKADTGPRRTSELPVVPRLVFIAGKRLATVDFG